MKEVVSLKRVLLSLAFVSVVCGVIAMVFSFSDNKSVSADIKNLPTVILDAGHAALENTID